MDEIREVRKREGRIVPFDRSKIVHAIYRALRSVGEGDIPLSEELASAVVHFLGERFEGRIPDIEEIQDVVETVLMEMGHPRVAKAYILYRQKRAMVRESLEVRKDRPHGEGISFDYAAVEDQRSGRLSGRQPPVGLEVEEAQYGTSGWCKGKIVAALIREADLDPSVAEDVASTVERKVFESKTRRISTSLIRELVDNELFERGFRAKLERQQPIALPKYNLEQVIFGADSKEGYTYPKNPSEVREIIANRILHQYSLQEVFSPAVADAHREGRIFIHRLTDPIRLARLRWDLPQPQGVLRGIDGTERLCLADGPAGARWAGDAGSAVVEPDGAEMLGAFLDRGDFFRQLSHLEHFVSEEIRLANLFQLLVDASPPGEDPRELAREVLDRIGSSEGGPDIALEIDLSGVHLPWLQGLWSLSRQRCRRFVIAVRLGARVPAADSEVARCLSRLYKRGDRFEFWSVGRPLPAGSMTPAVSATLSKITLNLPRAAYRSGQDRRGSIESELDRALDLAVRGLMERRQFAARLAQNRESPLWGLLARSSDRARFLDLEKDVDLAVGVLGLNECVKFLTGRELHQDPQAVQRGVELIRYIRGKLDRDARTLGLRLRLEETDNLGPLHAMERADRRLFPEIAEIEQGRQAGGGFSYSDGVRLLRTAPVDPLKRLEELSRFLDDIDPSSGVVEEVPELRGGDCELLLALLEESLPILEPLAPERAPIGPELSARE